MRLFDFFSKKDIVPEGTFRAPTFQFRLDNASHGGGYHIHLYKIINGKYYLTNIVFTKIQGKVFAYSHCEGKCDIRLKFNQIKKRNSIKQLIKDGLIYEIKKNKQWTSDIPQKRAHMFDI